MNKYLEKIAEKKSVSKGNFKSPSEVNPGETRLGYRNLQWDGKKIHDPNQWGSWARAERLEKAKDLLTKKRITIGIKAGLTGAAVYGAAKLGKSIMNNIEAD